MRRSWGLGRDGLWAMLSREPLPNRGPRIVISINDFGKAVSLTALNHQVVVGYAPKRSVGFFVIEDEDEEA